MGEFEGRIREGAGRGNSLETPYTQLDRELYSSQPRLTTLLSPPFPSLASVPFFFFHPCSSFIRRSRPSSARVSRSSSLHSFSLSPGPRSTPAPSSCFRALHSTVKGKVCNEISSERSPRDHYARERGWAPEAGLLVIVASNRLGL